MNRPDHAEIDGQPASAADLHGLATVNYGHYTTMQVRGRRVRGLALHLERLDDATRELFGTSLEHDRVRQRLRHALDRDDASVRITVFGRAGEPTLLVSVSEPITPSGAPVRLRSVPFVRALPHIKHVGSFPQAYYRRLARRDGFDEALLVGPDGSVAEGAITNVGFLDAGIVVWPSASALLGITMQLVRKGLEEKGIPCERRPVALGDLASFEAAFLTNSQGVLAVESIDAVRFARGAEAIEPLVEAYERTPWDTI